MRRELEYRKTLGEVRAIDDGSLTGYAATWGVTCDLGDFKETIQRGCFARAIVEKQDVRALFNHNEDNILGRTKSGTLTLAEDKLGLKFSILLAKSPLAQSVREAVMRGDIDGCSFGFRCVRDRWDGDMRTLLDADLFDVGPVTYPAYDQTSVSARSRQSRQVSVRSAGVQRTVREGVYRSPAAAVAVADLDLDRKILTLKLRMLRAM